MTTQFIPCIAVVRDRDTNIVCIEIKPDGALCALIPFIPDLAGRVSQVIEFRNGAAAIEQ